jgi:methionine-rich copper-binding protein CopC
VDAGAGDDQVFLVLGSEFADEAHGGAGVDRLEVVATGSKSMSLVGYDANGGFVMSAYTDSSFSRVAQTLTAVTFDLNTGNGYPGVWFDGFENLSLIAHPADDSWDLLTVVGTGTYDGGGATDTLFADWGGATAGIIWNNLASSVSQSVNGSTIRNVERLLLSTGSGSDDIRNTVASTSDEFFTGPGDDVVYAGGGNDGITGGSGNDSLFGGDGNDSLVPGAGEDLADGGAGSDTAVFAGNRADYTVTRNASGTVVIVTSVAEGTDRLLAIETLQFADGARGTSSTGTVDAAAPALASATPPSGSSGASTEADIVLTFSESVEAGSGSVWLKTSDGTTVEQFNLATSTRLQISANTLTVRPTADLVSMTGYRIELDAGSLKDIVGNPITALSSYSFTTGAASYTGGSGNDSLVGDGWGNLFLTGLGNDTVDGGGGEDTAALPLFPNVFSLSAGTGAGSASGSYRAGPDTFSLDLTGIELVRFGSTFQTTVPLAELTSGRAQDSLAKLTDLYLAFFGRAPDVGGLEYWQEILLESGRDFATISADFAWSTEAQALFPQGGSNRDFVRTVYLNCFGREPDQAGWDWWTERLNALNPNDPQYLNNRGSFVGEVILGAYAPTSGAEDRNLLTNRHEVAMDYANRLVVQPGEGFDAAINDLLERVTGDAATRTGATAVLQHVFDHPVTLTGVMGDAVLFNTLWG